jgi:hypothetical protein
MKNHCKIKLPDTLIKNRELLEQFVPTPPMDYGFFEPNAVLSDELLAVFDQLKIKARSVVVFGHKPNTIPTKERRLIHTDVMNKTGTEWNKIVCGINWELYEHTITDFHWWDMSALPEVWPTPLTTPQAYHGLNSIHYGHRLKFGMDPSGILLDTTVITHNTPTLVRTNVPHQTAFNTRGEPRLSLSVRFHETWDTWEEALEIFKPLII